MAGNAFWRNNGSSKSVKNATCDGEEEGEENKIHCEIWHCHVFVQTVAVVWHLAELHFPLKCYSMRGKRTRRAAVWRDSVDLHWSVTALEQPLVRSSLMSRKYKDLHQTTNPTRLQAVFTMRLHVMQRTVLWRPFCPSVCLPSVKRVLCDKTKENYAHIFILHKNIHPIVFW